MTESKFYFVLEPGGSEQGPFSDERIAELVAQGSVTPQARLLRVGEFDAVPIAQVQLPQPKRRAHGTVPPPVPPPAPTAMMLAPPPMDTIAMPRVSLGRPRKTWILATAAGGIA